MEGSPCPTNSAYDYAYAKTSKLAIRLLISRAGMRCDEISTGYLGENTSRNQQQSPSDEFGSSAFYTDKDYENAENTCVKNSSSYQGANVERLQVDCGASPLSYENFPGSSSGHFSEKRIDPQEYVEMGKRRGVQFAVSEDKYSRNALPKEKEGSGNSFLLEIEKFRSCTISPDEHHENISAKNSSSNEGENDESLKLDCKACGFSYENSSSGSSGHFSAERTDPEEYVEMGKRRGVQLADSEDNYGRNGLSKEEKGPGNLILVETGKLRSSASYPDKHCKNISAKNNLSNEGENDGRLRLDCRACGLSYENVSGSSTSHSSAERTDPEEYVEMGKTRGVQCADSEDKYGRNALPKEKEGPGNPFLVEIEKFRSSTIFPDKHNENLSAKNNSSNEGENDERLRLDCRAGGLPYENLPGSSTSHFSAERIDPEEYVEMGKRRSVELADSRGQPGDHGFPGPTLKKRVLTI